MTPVPARLGVLVGVGVFYKYPLNKGFLLNPGSHIRHRILYDPTIRQDPIGNWSDPMGAYYSISRPEKPLKNAINVKKLPKMLKYKRNQTILQNVRRFLNLTHRKGLFRLRGIFRLLLAFQLLWKLFDIHSTFFRTLRKKPIFRVYSITGLYH